ncbi:hypothetical protein [Spirosoma flavum]|uniref:Uncharacterized protein n=1 Tax=Spirosoma flavum TaxID=2048557 RepID=A0ABW6AQF0_9BACT
MDLSKLIAKNLIAQAETQSQLQVILHLLKKNLSENEIERVDLMQRQIFLDTLIQYHEDGLLTLEPAALEVSQTELASIENRLEGLNSERTESE